MQIKDILKYFYTRCTIYMHENLQRASKNIAIHINGHNIIDTVDMQESYWYFEDDGTIVFRINDTTGLPKSYIPNKSIFQAFIHETETFLDGYGETEQEEYEIDDIGIIGSFYFFTNDDEMYHRVEKFTIDEDDKNVIININL